MIFKHGQNGNTVMAASNFPKCFKFILQFEGGFTNDPKDPGGPTNLGITQATLSAFVGRQATIAEVRALTPDKAEPIYRGKFWDHVNGDNLPVGIDLAVFDFGVHSGPSRGVAALQRAIGVADDGSLGPITTAAAKRADPKTTINAICDDRLAFIKKTKAFKVPRFQKGLLNRVAKCRRAALAMV
jgi:lysozyme family protein